MSNIERIMVDAVYKVKIDTILKQLNLRTFEGITSVTKLENALLKWVGYKFYLIMNISELEKKYIREKNVVEQLKLAERITKDVQLETYWNEMKNELDSKERIGTEITTLERTLFEYLDAGMESGKLQLRSDLEGGVK